MDYLLNAKHWIFPLIVATTLFASGCSEPYRQPAGEDAKEELKGPVENIEKAHAIKEFASHPAVKFDLLLKSGDKVRLDATISMKTNSTGVRVDRRDGAVILYDGGDVCIAPPKARYKGARFDALTWSYFFALPQKLGDPGTSWQEKGPLILQGDSLDTGKLTFETGIGDTPEDWYLVYYEPEDYVVRAAAYIVSFKKSLSEANADPHCITYENYKEVNGVPFAHKWRFWEWNKDRGLGNQLMEGDISNVEFFKPSPTHFSPSENCATIPKED